MALLEVKNLSIIYSIESGKLKAVDQVSFNVGTKENFGLVGESGCGKTTIAKAILRLLPSNGKISKGEIWFKGQNIPVLPKKEMRDIRWKEISMITQSAMHALDPVYTIGQQISEAILAHRKTTKSEAKRKTRELLELVGIEDERINDYPHQFSGGMKQRAIIAMSLALEPSLILADEPTTALDVITQDQIITEIIKLQEISDISLTMITHDVSIISEVCEMVGVMYAGEMVECGPILDLFEEPWHPYTMGLLNAFPSLDGNEETLIAIPGSPPDLKATIEGCKFADRCAFSSQICKEKHPRVTHPSERHPVACHKFDQHEEFLKKVKEGKVWESI